MFFLHHIYKQIPLLMLFFSPPQHVPLISRWKWGGALFRGGVPEGHPQRPALPIGYRGRARSADVTELPWPAGFWAPEDSQGHVRKHTYRHSYKYQPGLRSVDEFCFCSHVCFLGIVSDWLFCPLLPIILVSPIKLLAQWLVCGIMWRGYSLGKDS